jgi:two-component system, LytTR family, sensor kinase
MNRQNALNDRVVKIVGIPALGILVPNMTGLITNRLYTPSELVACYLFFTVIAFLVWEGNVRLMYFIRAKIPWSKRVYYRIIVALFLANVVYSGIVSTVLLRLWITASREPQDNNDHLVNTVLIIIIAACFITNIYEIIFLNLEKEYNESRVEQLNVAKAQAELEALKNQIDPHFIFNSLNTLSFLITRDPKNARLYNDTLARVYRYILSNKDRDLVLLREEIDFISNYFYLLKIRFAGAISMVIEITDLSAENYLIPPISLQALVENAIKHNEFSEKKPLCIDVSISADYVIVRNALNRRSNPQPTSKIGLSNLDNRYKLLTKRNIQVENNFESFTVKLPIIRF